MQIKIRQPALRCPIVGSANIGLGTQETDVIKKKAKFLGDIIDTLTRGSIDFEKTVTKGYFPKSNLHGTGIPETIRWVEPRYIPMVQIYCERDIDKHKNSEVEARVGDQRCTLLDISQRHYATQALFRRTIRRYISKLWNPSKGFSEAKCRH